MVRDDRGLPHYFVLQVENIDSRRHSEERERELFNPLFISHRPDKGSLGISAPEQKP